MKNIKLTPPTRRRIVKGAGALVAGIVAPALVGQRAARADYPDRPVKFVVANTPGGPSDIIARIVTAALDQSTGKTFIVENRGGAGGNIGMEYVARSNPDGYTILLATNAFSVNYGLYNQLPYDPYKDFVAVSATKSLTLLAGDSALTTNALGVVASSLTATKSLYGSYGS